MENKDLCHNHNMLDLCIKQGYVPPNCTLDGMIVFGLVQEGKNPCIGCNVNCHHEQKSLTQKSLTPLEREQQLEQQYYYEMENIKNREKERKKKERINKRKAQGNINGFIMIDTDYYKGKPEAVITVIKLLEEKMYTHNCKTVNEVVAAIPLICRKYHINQVIIDTHGFGIAVADALNGKIFDNDIDIVPMRVSKMIF